MKKLIAFLLMVIVTLGVFGCGPKDKPAEEVTADDTTSEVSDTPAPADDATSEVSDEDNVVEEAEGDE